MPVEVPGWLRELRRSPTAWQDFTQWLQTDLRRAEQRHRSAQGWDAVQKERGRLETLEGLDRWRQQLEEEVDEQPVRIRAS